MCETRAEELLGIRGDGGLGGEMHVGGTQHDVFVEDFFLALSFPERAGAEEHLVKNDAEGPDVYLGGDAWGGGAHDEAFRGKVPVGAGACILGGWVCVWACVCVCACVGGDMGS